MSPFPNEHGCRLLDPDQFDDFRRVNCAREVDGKCVDHIYGLLTETSVDHLASPTIRARVVSRLQSLRYRLSEGWTEEDARRH